MATCPAVGVRNPRAPCGVMIPSAVLVYAHVLGEDCRRGET